MTLRTRLRHIWRIARWEVSLSSTSLDRRTLLTAVVLLVVAGSIAGTAVVFGLGGLSPNQDIYRVGIDADSPYYPVVDGHSALTARPADPALLDRGEIELLVRSGGDSETVTLSSDADVDTSDVTLTPSDQSMLSVRYADTEKGTAALTTFRGAVERYNDRLMALESNQTAAYPVDVQLQYQPQQSRLERNGGASPDDDTATDDDDTDDDDTDDDDTDDDESTADQPDDEQDATGDMSVDDQRDDPQVANDDGSLVEQLFADGAASGSPAEISPPFPFGSLLLAFVFLVPMNFIIQAYGGTILNERINRRGELLLVAPLARVDIVAGKTLPYLLASIVAIAAIGLGIGGGVISILAVLPLALAFLAATFVGAMFARSFKELTFVTVTISVCLMSYAFIPAIFTNVTPIALISPLTLVVMELQNEAVGVGAYVFSTAPFYLGSGILFLLGVGVYREEDMFTQKPVPVKFLDALDARLRGPKSVAVVSALMIPFVFVAELLAIAVLFVVPIELSVPIILVVMAAIEEVAKSIHIYAGFESDRFGRSTKVALLLGALSGFGFFVGEKFTAIAQLVGLPDLTLGSATLTPGGVTPAATLGLLVAPLVLHMVTAAIGALGAKRDLRWYLGTLVVATLVHAAYNFTVVSIYG